MTLSNDGRHTITLSMSRENMEKLLRLDSFWTREPAVELTIDVTEREFQEMNPDEEIREHLTHEVTVQTWCIFLTPGPSFRA